jgi:hypothetical protein
MEDFLLSFSRMEYILFYFVQEVLFIKSKNWNEEISNYAQDWLIGWFSLAKWNEIT